MNSRIVYSPDYDFSLYGLDKLHYFDAHKFSKAWNLLLQNEPSAKHYLYSPEKPCSDQYLAIAHTEQYIHSLQKSSVIAEVIEVGLAKFVPASILKENLLKPIRLATQGTLMATELALRESAIVMNMGGGFHHAFADHGEGFCFFADAALAILHARSAGLIAGNDHVLMIDLDAHRGNGFESFFIKDEFVTIFDMYNFQNYPGLHTGDVDDYPYMIPVRSGITGSEYLRILEEDFPPFLTSINKPKLAFYNAGTDILKGDPLGQLNVEYENVVKRDQYVIQKLKEVGVPTVVMTSGGYTKESFKLIAALAETVIKS
jgi:histone deacetylase 11